MFRKKTLLLLIFISNLEIISYSQDSLNFNYVAPLDIPLSVSGDFGDIRDNTFHFGIDFRTNEKEGYPVFAVADGYISRIKVESGGYGNALYLNHSNGFTSVYAHLKTFSKTINKYIKNEQYKRHTFKIDIELTTDSFKVKQCDTIGFSGNKGYSSGPHLHFELRKTATQNPVNCLSNGIFLSDTLPPVVTKLWVYPGSDYIPYDTCPRKNFDIVGINGNYNIKKGDTVLLTENTGFGIEAYDYISDTSSGHSFYYAKLYVDTTLWFETFFDEISFEQVGYVNSFIDYEKKVADNSVIFKLFKWPNQDLMFIKATRNDGYICFEDTLIHSLKIILADVNGNYSEVKFYVRKTKKINSDSLCTLKPEGSFLRWKKENIIHNKNVKIVFPENSLYSNIDFTYYPVKTRRLPYIPVSIAYQIGNVNIPLKGPFYLSFPLDNMASSIRNKLVIAAINKKRNISSIGGTINGNHITAQAKFFGIYAMFADTLPPIIKPLNIKNDKNMFDEDSIKFRISDELSGIQDFSGTIDNKWVLFEFDAKNNFLYYAFDTTRFKTNQKYHHLELMVSDKKGNKRKYIANFKK